jgi:hypothetical protein
MGRRVVKDQPLPGRQDSIVLRHSRIRLGGELFGVLRPFEW